MCNRARGVAAHQVGDLLLGLERANQEGMVLDGTEPVDDAVTGIDHQQQVGQGVEHGALAAFAFFDFLHQPSAAHQVLHAMAQQVPVDGLGEEVRGTCFVGVIDGGHVVATGDHHDGQVRAARQRADQFARVVAVHGRHFHVHEHGIAGTGFDGGHRRSAIRRLGYHEAGAFERAPHQQARAGIVVDDEYVYGGSCAAHVMQPWLNYRGLRARTTPPCAAREVLLATRGVPSGRRHAPRVRSGVRSPRRWWRRDWRWSS